MNAISSLIRRIRRPSADVIYQSDDWMEIERGKRISVLDESKSAIKLRAATAYRFKHPHTDDRAVIEDRYNQSVTWFDKTNQRNWPWYVDEVQQSSEVWLTFNEQLRMDDRFWPPFDATVFVRGGPLYRTIEYTYGEDSGL